jgi:hypothetical protein
MKISFDMYIYILDVDCCPIFNKFLLLHKHHIMNMEFEQRWPTTNINTMNNHFWHQIMEQTKTYWWQSMSRLRTRITYGGFIQMSNFICWYIFNFCDIFYTGIRICGCLLKREEVTLYNTTVYSYTVITIVFNLPLMFKTDMFHITYALKRFKLSLSVVKDAW